MNTFENMKTLHSYTSSLLVLADFARDYYNTLTEPQKAFIESEEEFSGYRYSVINGEVVVLSDDVTGDVYSVQTIAEMAQKTASFLRENLPNDLPPYQESADKFCEAIKVIAERPEALENLRHYLARNFPDWLRRFGKYPEDFAFDFNEFATMQF